MELLRCLHTLRQSSLRKAAQAADLARGLGRRRSGAGSSWALAVRLQGQGSVA